MKTMFQFLVIGLSLAVAVSGRDMNNRPETPLVAATNPTAVPDYKTAEHNVGDMAMAITNRGVFGSGYALDGLDCFTGLPVQSCEYPRGSQTKYLFTGAIWIGGIINGDTLVSTSADGWSGGEELNPDSAPLGGITYRSIFSTGPAATGAVSAQDFLTAYWDTCKVNCPGLRNDAIDVRPHRPLNIRIDQRTFAWSTAETQSAVFFDLKITNVGTATINKGYVGIYVDGDVYAPGASLGHEDDVSGFFNAISGTNGGCAFDRQIPVAWIADNDGDLISPNRVPNVTATALLGPSAAVGTVSYNWWASNGTAALDFGPMRKANYRDFKTGGLGTPVGDRNKYWMLGNGDIDYNQAYIASIESDDSIWMYPNQLISPDLTDGWDTRYLLSVGPFDLDPGESIPLAFAYVGGKNFHTVANNTSNLPNNPGAYEANLGFADLKQNVLWASWVYDNPGVDTDTDGYSGEFVVCGLDTSWVAGDGVPDFRAAAPPPRPQVWATPQTNAVHIRWNGAGSESDRDFFTSAPDFEGYNVYLKKKNDTAWQTVAGYDIEDYFKARYNAPYNQWTVDPRPSTSDDLRCRYAPGGCDDSLWSATSYLRTHPFVLPGFPDSIFYWVPVGCNAHKFGYETPILKTYPTAPKPRWSRVGDVPADSLDLYVTADGKFKFYEYELTISNLTPADSYLVSVTALDFGRASLTSFTPLETRVDDGAIVVVPLSAANCCFGMTGNVDCSPNGSVDIADLTLLIDHMFLNMSPLCCGAEANVDGDPDGRVDISDLTRMIDFLFVNFTPMTACE